MFAEKSYRHIRGRGLTEVAKFFNLRRKTREYLPIMGDRWLRVRLMSKIETKYQSWAVVNTR